MAKLNWKLVSKYLACIIIIRPVNLHGVGYHYLQATQSDFFTFQRKPENIVLGMNYKILLLFLFIII